MNMRLLTICIPAIIALLLCSCQRNGAPPAVTAPAAIATPTFKYVKGKEGGCANLFLYKGTADDLEVLWIRATKDKLKLPVKGSQAFDLAAARDGLQVAI